MSEVKEKKVFTLDDGTTGSRAAYIRQEFMKGRTRSDIAKELGVPFSVVYAATANMDNGVNTHGRTVMIELPDGTKMPRSEYIRQEFMKGRTRSDIAKELDVPYQIVYAATKGMTNGATGSRGRVMIQDPETGELVPRTELIRKLYEQGKTRREIANMLQVDYAVVWNATKPKKDDKEEEKSITEIAEEMLADANDDDEM